MDTRTDKLPKGKYWQYMDAINPYKFQNREKIEIQGVLCVKHNKRYYRADNGLPFEELELE